jgi:hypothetical protein
MDADEITDDRSPFAGIPCRKCGVPALRLEKRLEARPIGSFSIAGAQTKVSALEWPWCVCDSCGAESRGKRA